MIFLIKKQYKIPEMRWIKKNKGLMIQLLTNYLNYFSQILRLIYYLRSLKDIFLNLILI